MPVPVEVDQSKLGGQARIAEQGHEQEKGDEKRRHMVAHAVRGRVRCSPCPRQEPTAANAQKTDGLR